MQTVPVSGVTNRLGVNSQTCAQQVNKTYMKVTKNNVSRSTLFSLSFKTFYRNKMSDDEKIIKAIDKTTAHRICSGQVFIME